MTRPNRLLARLTLGLSLVAGLASTTSAASAQGESRLQARIPFAFSANREPQREFAKLTPQASTFEIAMK